MRLYSYHRNAAGERVRIALGLKGLSCDYVSAPALPREAWLALNPQGLLPALEVDGRVVAQAAAILEYLEEAHPEPPLLPRDRLLRAEARAFAQHIASDLHPLTVIRVRDRLVGQFGAERTQLVEWCRHWTSLGLAALEATLRRRPKPWPFCFGDAPGWADLHLVPQLRNARRFGCDLAAQPLLAAVEARCLPLEAFQAALPERQPDHRPGAARDGF